MKKVLIIVGVLLILGGGVFFFLSSKNGNDNKEQVVLNQTLEISTKYLALRYQTDNVLINAKDFGSYDKWKEEMSKIINDWQKLENEAIQLEKIAETLPSQEISLQLNKPIYAYDRNEISNVFDKAPAGKKIATLAKYLGVDAKRAQLILNQDQDQVTADAWNNAGDTLQKLETSAIVIKDGCKVAGFVGTTVLTGGSAALMTGSTLAKVAVVVSGADLTLEVGSDAATIALGNHNKISAIANDARKITEPLAGVLTISTMPGNLTKGIEKLNAITFTAEQINSGVQDGKIIGIEIPEVKIELNNKFENIKKYKTPVYVSKIDPSEIDKWVNENNINSQIETKTEIETALNLNEITKISEEKQDDSKQKLATNNSDLDGTHWKGVLVNVSGGDGKKRSNDFEITLNKDGSATLNSKDQENEEEDEENGEDGLPRNWSQEGNSIKIFGENKESGYYVFEISGDTLVFSKIVVEGKDVMAGSEFMGGIAPIGILYKQ